MNRYRVSKSRDPVSSRCRHYLVRKRAVTIRVDDVRGVAGFILPNDRVDLYSFAPRLIRVVAKTIRICCFRDVKVIAVDQIVSERKDNPTVAKAVTLEVTPQEAQKITLATDIGHLSLILRKAGDSNVVDNQRVTTADLGGGGERAVPVPARVQVPAQAPSPPDATVWIIRDLKSQDYKVVREAR